MRTAVEKKAVSKMIALYCRKKHGGKDLCEECEKLQGYALLRLDRCRYGDSKGACSHCSTPCYAPQWRAEIIKVMKFSGPRLLFHSPLAAIRHLISR